MWVRTLSNANNLLKNADLIIGFIIRRMRRRLRLTFLAHPIKSNTLSEVICLHRIIETKIGINL